MTFNAQPVSFQTEEEATQAILGLEASEESAKIMAPKALFRVIRLENVRNAVANILKQEMLSVGGDAAVSKYTVDCSKPATDVLLFGTLKQFRRVLMKMRGQGYGIKGKSEYAEKFKEYVQLAEEIESVLKSAP